MAWCDTCKALHETYAYLGGIPILLCPACPPGFLFCFTSEGYQSDVSKERESKEDCA